jgi:GNAT superfamily N-acetyltransferase
VRSQFESDLFLAFAGQNLVGMLGIEDNALRYSDHHVLVDAYFFVLPEYRSSDVGIRLMQAATLEAERRQLPLMIRVTNPERAKRRGRVADIAGYFPTGYVVRLR